MILDKLFLSNSIFLKTLKDTLKATDNQYIESLKKKIFEYDN